jgi:hypothetical protein
MNTCQSCGRDTESPDYCSKCIGRPATLKAAEQVGRDQRWSWMLGGTPIDDDAIDDDVDDESVNELPFGFHYIRKKK